MSIDLLIAARLQRLRKLQGLTIEALAAKAGVSRGMISKIERQDSSPSAQVLGRLAAGLGVPLAELIIDELERGGEDGFRPRDQQTLWRDPEAGYLRRQVSEREADTGLELVEITLPPGASVSYPRWSSAPYRQRLWLVTGVLAITYGERHYALSEGDCLIFGVDLPLNFTNPGAQDCRYLLVIAAK
ncbi:hypothetical protein SODG_006659 [Sodalis praecaptivus]|uniref:helix-turn-helix domain-containing protein n=1 Tax=Sodalis praecaptivus TaxID=1239307 RepID=UPI0027F0DF60|nr:helix-turn-helix domain-containing protein [Sodalis praecaptivus]CAJ0998165.1 hypothetical protein NVIRENTERO_03200 [Sodalis praecaptivus]